MSRKKELDLYAIRQRLKQLEAHSVERPASEILEDARELLAAIDRVFELVDSCGIRDNTGKIKDAVFGRTRK